MEQKDISKFLVQYEARPVTHAALIQGGQTIAVLPTDAQRKHYLTRGTLLTLIEIPMTADYRPQEDLNGILFMDGEVNEHDVIPGTKGFLKRAAREPISEITDCMAGEGRIFHLPHRTPIYDLFKDHTPHI